MEKIKDILNHRILVLDGAMGTMVQSYDLKESDFRGEEFKDHHSDLIGNNDILSLTRPDIVNDIHTAYLDAGADLIETNTFNSTSISQADYNMEDIVYRLNYSSAKIAVQAAKRFTKKDPEKPRFVCGYLTNIQHTN